MENSEFSTEEIQEKNSPSPETVEEPENGLPLVKVADLTPRLQAAIARAGWQQLTPVQSKALPYIFAGRPMMVQARTGSGKTGAFILPVMELVNRLQKDTQALVLVPTRELAQQVTAEAKMLFGDDELRVTAVYGGVGYGSQFKALKEGTQLVVGTPGRILDHLLRRTLNLDNLEMFIFDEADRLLGMGFYEDMLRLQPYLPKNVYTCMFSATFPPAVRSLARTFMQQPEFLSLSRDQVYVAETVHQTVDVPALEKDRILIRLIEQENPDSAIIFCNTKTRVHYVAVVLQRFGYNADELSGDLSQRDRDKVMNKLRRGKLRFLVATDVAARGIDISELSHVFLYEVPDDPELYIHRAGRTGRAGAAGVAITLVGEFTEQMQIKRIAKQYNIDFEKRPSPTEEEVSALVAERTIIRLEAQLQKRDKLKIERMQRFVPFVQELTNDEHGLELIAMLLDDYYQQSLHQPPATLETAVSQSQSSKPKKKKGRRRRRRRHSKNRSN